MTVKADTSPLFFFVLTATCGISYLMVNSRDFQLACGAGVLKQYAALIGLTSRFPGHGEVHSRRAACAVNDHVTCKHTTPSCNNGQQRVMQFLYLFSLNYFKLP